MRRFTFSINQKIALWIVGFVLLWRGLTDPFVIEAILTFGLTGRIPGTSIVLSPDTVILLSAGLVITVAWVVLARRKRGLANIANATHTRPMATSHQAVTPRLYDYDTTPQSITAMPPVRHYTWIGRICSQLLLQIRQLAMALWAWMAPYLWKFDAWLGAWFHYFLRRTQQKMQANATTSVMIDFIRLGKRNLQGIANRYRRN